jgi:dipeptidyl aminopeptidase/acylaminoacyl peptidase
MEARKHSFRLIDKAIAKVLWLFMVVVYVGVATLDLHAEKHSVSVGDCVSMRELIGEPQVAPDGERVAYVVKHPNTITNQNEYEIRVRTLSGPLGTDNGRLIGSYHDDVSGLKWLRDGRHLVFLVGHARTIRKPSRIIELDRTGATNKIIAADPNGIAEFSVSSDGKAVSFLVAVKPTPTDTPIADKRLVARGFSVRAGFGDDVAWKRGMIVEHLALRVSRKSDLDHSWSTESVSPPDDALLDGQRRGSFGLVYGLSMSPNGRYLALVYQAHRPSPEWNKNRTASAYLKEFGINPHRLGMYDLALHRFIDVPLTPFPHVTWWSDDSESYASLSAAPIGSKWETEDTVANDAPRGTASLHVFAVDVRTMQVSEILSAIQAQSADISIVSWERGRGTMLIEDEEGKRVTRLARHDDEWKQEQGQRGLISFSLNPARFIGNARFVGVHQDTKHPPDLWYVDGSSNQRVQLTLLNPSVEEFALGRLEDIEWKNTFGVTVSGKLILPPGADPVTRYPLVIMLTWPNEEFVCDGHYHTAFAPQSLASAGFVVAMFNVYDAFPETGKQPSGPPQTKEAESTLSSVHSLVTYLDERGIIQRDNIGIVGFSRSSWKVDYVITHSDLPFNAASSADSGIGNYGFSWLDDRGSLGREIEVGYGGPFSGNARSAWLESAPAFNAERVSTPLLMEYTGLNGIFEQPYPAYEFHAALVGLGKPVELYFYPQGDHPLDTPFERISSLQRNVDWFRFWMQQYEGDPPSYDPDQYVRWRRLRQLRTGPTSTK